MLMNFTASLTGRFQSAGSSTVIAVVDNFTVTADIFINHDYASISANDFTVVATDRLNNRNNATITTTNFNVTANNFYNQNEASISVDNFTVTADNFRNTATIDAINSNITANSCTSTTVKLAC